MMGIFSKLTFVAFGYYFLKLEKLCYMGKNNSHLSLLPTTTWKVFIKKTSQ